MSLTKLRKPKPDQPDPTRRYRAWTSFCSAAGSVVKGEVYRGDDPVVLSAPGYFVDDEDVLERDQPTEIDVLVSEHEQREEKRKAALEAAAAENRLLLTVELLRARRDFIVHRHNGRPATILEGSVVVATDLLAAHNPAEFEPVR